MDLEERIDTVKKQIEQVEVKTNDEFERVMKVKDKNDYIKILSQEIDTAEKSVLAFTELKKDHEVLRQSFKSAKAKKVDVRMLGKLDDTNKSIAKELSSHGVDIKHSDHSLSAFVIDDNKVILGLSDFSKDRPEYHFTIWQNHPDIANALKHYFNHVWNNVPVSKKK